MKEPERSKLKKKILDELVKTPIVEIACKKAGIDRSTFYRWCEQDRSFRDEAEQTRLESRWAVNDLAESKIISRIKNDDYPATTFWLKHNHHNYYQRGQDRRTVPYPTEVSEDPFRRIAFNVALESESDHQDKLIADALRKHWQDRSSWFQDCITEYADDPERLLQIKRVKDSVAEDEFANLIEVFHVDKSAFIEQLEVLDDGV